MFQEFNSSGDIGLVAVQNFCGLSEIFVFGHIIEDSVVFVIYIHLFRPFF